MPGKVIAGLCINPTRSLPQTFIPTNTVPKIVYVLSHRSSDKYRVKNLFNTVYWLVEIKKELKDRKENKIDLSIVVVEQDTVSNISITTPEVDHVFAYNPGHFNRGWGFNIAVRKYTDADYFFFADNDILLRNGDIINVFNSCLQFEAVNPYSRIFDTTIEIHDTSNNIFEYCDGKKLASYISSERKYTCFSGGIVGLSSSAIKLLSGWDERFTGRGYEDYVFTAKVNLFLNNIFTFPFTALHLYHPSEQNTSSENNKLLFEEYEKYSLNNYINLIHNTNEFFGNINKYRSNDIVKFDFFLSNTFKENINHAISFWEQLYINVKSKHEKDFQNIFFQNLCGLHACNENHCPNIPTNCTS